MKISKAKIFKNEVISDFELEMAEAIENGASFVRHEVLGYYMYRGGKLTKPGSILKKHTLLKGYVWARSKDFEEAKYLMGYERIIIFKVH